MIQDNWPKVVYNDDGIRPAGKPDECFYCRNKVGQSHSKNCVIVTKRIKLRYTIDVEINVPHFWTKETIEFHRNENGWCADNLISELEEFGEEKGCLCNYTTAEYVETVDDKPFREVTK
mgnify:CR=1 FL=1